MNTPFSKVLNMGSIDGCIQPHEKVKSRLSFSGQITCSNMDIRAVVPPQSYLTEVHTCGLAMI